MGPTIALALCIIFILYVLRTESGRQVGVSSALWVPVLWLLMIGSRTPSQWINIRAGVSPEEVMSGNLLDQVVISVFLLAGLHILSKRKIGWEGLFRDNAWILVWFLYCGVSIVWSDFPGAALRKWIKGWTTYVMALVVLTEPDPFESVKAVIRRAAYVLIPLSVVLVKYVPAIGTGWNEWGARSLAGITIGKNQLGRLCLACGMNFLADLGSGLKAYLHRRRAVLVNMLTLLMAIWLLRASDSATSLGALIAGMLIFMVLGLPLIRRNAGRIGKMIVLAVAAVAFLWVFTDIDRAVVHGLGRNMTLTERTYLWDELLSLGTNPAVGTGYESFWIGNRLTLLSDRLGWMPNEAHNGYLEIYLELGIIGLFLMLMMLWSAYRSIRNSLESNFEFGRYRMTFLIIFLLYNITEANVKALDLMWFVFLLTAIESSRASEVQASSVGGGNGRKNGEKAVPGPTY